MRAKRAGGLAGRLTRLEADPGQTDQRALAAVALWLPSHHRGGLQPGTYEQYSGTATLVVYTRLGGPGPRLLATTNNDLNASDDGGRTWQSVGIDQVLPWKYTRALAQLPGRREVPLLGGGDRPPGWEGAIARSEDGGRSWKRVRMPRANSTVWAFAVHAADAALVYRCA